MKTINRTWFKNQLKAGNLLVKCNGKYTDDYAFDAAYKFFRTDEFAPAAKDMFGDWKLKTISIYGEKDGIINVSFASCEYYEFKVK